MTAQEKKYKGTDKMAEIICSDALLLQVMTRFGMSLGFGDDNIVQVCERQGVDSNTFLAVINFVSQKHAHIENNAQVSVAALLGYLKQSHKYFLEFALPEIRKKLSLAIAGEGNELSDLVLRFFDDYMGEVRRHMEYEEQEVFPFVESLVEGRAVDAGSISTFSEHHDPVDEKLNELKNIIIKYYPSDGCNNQLNAALFDIFSCEQELKSHCKIEDYLFVPAVKNLIRGL
ncbi:MAG: hemerythrin domain-containing protein [Bacteroidales bacterium]|nr:hemerythrin domain-containing protein [Bacteroidales bacterium]